MIKGFYTHIENINFEKITLFFMGIYIFVLYVPHVTTIRDASLFIALLFATIITIRNNEWKELPLKIPFLLLLGIALVSLLVSSNIYYSLGQIKKQILYGILTFWLFYAMTKNEKDFIFLCYFLIPIATIIIVMSFYYHYVLKIPNTYEVGNYLKILYYDRAAFSFFMQTIGLLCLGILRLRGISKVLRIYSLLLLPPSIFVLYFTQHRTTFVCVATVIFLLIGAQLKKQYRPLIKATFLLLMLSIIFLIFSLASKHIFMWTSPKEALQAYVSEPRLIAWSYFIRNHILKQPLLGTGFGNHDFFVPGLGLWYPHNLFLDYAVMTGIPGMIIIVLLFAKLFILFRKNLIELKNSNHSYYILSQTGLFILVVFMILNMTHTILITHVGLFFWAVMGLILGSCRDINRKTIS